MHDILGLLIFSQYLPRITHQTFLILIYLVTENILALFYHPSHIHYKKVNLYILTNIYILA